jgi:hypothetical protein
VVEGEWSGKVSRFMEVIRQDFTFVLGKHVERVGVSAELLSAPELSLDLR